MSARPAGYSSEEDFSDDDFGEFSIDSDMKVFLIIFHILLPEIISNN